MIDERTKNKSISVSAIMNNAKLFKAVSEGLNAPLGSSKRTKAVSILGAFNKGDKKMILDGKGGMMELDPQGMPIQPVQPIPEQQLSPEDTQLTVGADAIGQIKSKQMFSYPKEKPMIIGAEGLPVTAMPGEEYVPPISDTGVSIVEPSVPGEVSVIGTEEELGISREPGEKISLGVEEAPPGYQPPSTYEGHPWYDKLSEEDKTTFKDLIEYDISGFSTSTAVAKLMDDTEAMRRLGVPESLLPMYGASLAKQEIALAKTLKEEVGLTAAEANMTNLQERGLTITDNLTAYIKGKDKYIKNINSMMDRAKEYRKTLDMSLPENQRTMKNYNNYLSILKGRQQNRYIDFLNTGINYHNAELTRANNTYNDARQAFTEELAGKIAVGREDYERLSNILADMYQNVTGREQKAIEKTMLDNQKMQANLDSIKLVIKTSQAEAGIFDDEDSGWDKATESAQSQAEAAFIEDAKMKYAEITPQEAEEAFQALPNVEKLSWTAKDRTLDDRVTFVANRMLSDSQSGLDSDYYDEETGKFKWKAVPNDIRHLIEPKMEALIAEQRQAQAIAAGDEDAKSSEPIGWIRRILGKIGIGD